MLNSGDCSCGARSLKLVSFAVSSGATAPDLIRRRLASPDGETRSYWPPPPERNFVNISSDVPAGTAFTLQPVCFVKAFANDLSAYPSQITMLSLPSPFWFTSGPPAVVLVLPPPPLELELDLSSDPQAAMAAHAA